MRILKFGGKSLESKEKMQNVCRFIKKIYKKDKKIILVVSAMGKTTDELIQIANTFCDDCHDAREMDVLLSTGETMSASLVSMMLNSINIPAKSFQAFQLKIKTYGAHQSSRITSINKKPLLDCFENGHVAVVAGFQGINQESETTTLGRGGSDTTACALAAVFDVPVEIYSDFDGVFAGDPRELDFKKLKSVNHDIMKKMAEAGAKVLDSRATTIAKDFNIKIISKSSSEPHKHGSEISSLESDTTALCNIDNLCLVSVIFSNYNKTNFIAKIVINSLINIKFYNLSIENNKISFLVKQDEKTKIINLLSKKLNLQK